MTKEGELLIRSESSPEVKDASLRGFEEPIYISGVGGGRDSPGGVFHTYRALRKPQGTGGDMEMHIKVGFSTMKVMRQPVSAGIRGWRRQ